ncbi:FAD-dependent oxidoreductase [Cellulomonas fimi]|uniref:FAD-dependent oxidoreductase n=1 Tax=Cellulomonas fimi TaxID=1708 RepID=A0A7Y0M033_CELFI|nr:FAD-dependent oxidoreductase [Cellulomonas fimi]NMR21383.1 FAD-dependent oxidoreductase [Cellulomonas fimi]
MTSTFAFLVHPRTRLAEDMRCVWRPLGLVPEPVYDAALRRLPVPSTTRSDWLPVVERLAKTSPVTLAARVRSLLRCSSVDDAYSPTVVVAGGGPAGVEMAAALADVGRTSGGLHVVLVHRGDAVLPSLRSGLPSLADRGAAELERLGVDVRCGVGLEAVTPRAALLADGSLVVAATVLGTVGARPASAPGLDSLPTDADGRLVAGPDLAVAHHVWAAGGGAVVRHPVSGALVRADALWAIKDRGVGQAASFGVGRGIADLYGIPFTGALSRRRSAWPSSCGSCRHGGGRRASSSTWPGSP